MKISKKITNLEFGRKVLKICLILLMIAVLIPVIYSALRDGLLADLNRDHFDESNYFLINYLSEFINHLPLSIIIISATVIKIIDYWLIFHNKINKAFNVLGLITLLIWIIIVGSVLWNVGEFISLQLSELITNIKFSYTDENRWTFKANAHNTISAFIQPILFAIPTLCIFIYSLVLDIAGLRSKGAGV